MYAKKCAEHFPLEMQTGIYGQGQGVGDIGVPSNQESLLFLMIIFNLFQQIPAHHLLCVHACIRDLFRLCLSYLIIVETTNSMWHFAIHNVLLSSAYFDLEPKQCCGISMAGFIMPVSQLRIPRSENSSYANIYWVLNLCQAPGKEVHTHYLYNNPTSQILYYLHSTDEKAEVLRDYVVSQSCTQSR